MAQENGRKIQFGELRPGQKFIRVNEDGIPELDFCHQIEVRDGARIPCVRILQKTGDRTALPFNASDERRGEEVDTWDLVLLVD